MERSNEEIIIDYLTIKLIEDTKFICNPHIRLRVAWMESKKKFMKMNDEDKNKLLILAKKRKGL